jgi:hypothetical protein
VLALRGIRIVSVRVALADAAVLAVDQQLRVLVAGDLATGLDRLALGVMHRGQSLVAFAADGPFVAGRDDVLVLSYSSLLRRLCRP